MDVNSVPVLCAKDMDRLAEALIKDYKPSLLYEPQPVNYEHFLQSYLGFNLEYQDLRTENPNDQILGLTAFENDIAIIFDREDKCLKKIDIPKNTVVLSTTLLTTEQKGRLRFTALHEAAHAWLHRDYYIYNIFDNESLAIANCCSETVEGFTLRKCRSPEGWIEYQANYMASALAMPRTPFVELTRETLNCVGINKMCIVIGQDAGNDWFAQWELPAIIANNFGVSRKAASIKLSNFGFVVR